MTTGATTFPKQATSKSALLWRAVLLAIPVVTALLLFLLRQAEVRTLAAHSIQSYGIVPPFQLTDENAKPFGSQELKGKIWVADFIFTTCPDICPMISSRMAEMQKPLTGTDVRLVSFSVDPETDTPSVLKSYADRLHARPDRWTFLTGDKAAILNLSRDGFKLAATATGGGPDAQTPVHSSRLILVDRSGEIRGYYDATAPDSVTKLLADISHLRREQP